MPHKLNTYRRQSQILRCAANSKIPLSNALESKGLSYNDLVYKNSKTRSWNGIPPISLNDIKKKQQHIPFVSFFTGCGGMDIGFESVGYKHVASFEIDETFCKTLRHNKPHWKVFGPPTHSGDVANFEDVATTLSRIIKTPYEGVFIGGPPCQPFSIAANQRFDKNGENFKRVGFSNATYGGLLLDFVRLVLEFKPQAFVIENVPGLRDIDGGKQLSSAIKLLKDNGYHVEDPFILNAANFFIPQQRLRLFVIGSLSTRCFRPLSPSDKMIGAGSVLMRDISTLPNNETRMHKAESIGRYASLNYGERDHLGRVDRLDPTLPSKTVIAGGSNGGGRSHLHPEIPRTLSVRECAILQSFPDDYIFMGSTARQFTQVGNAVPPVLSAKIGSCIQGSFFK